MKFDFKKTSVSKKVVRIKYINSSDVIFNCNSIDNTFKNQSKNFGEYLNASNESVIKFTNDLKELIDAGVQKSGKYRTVKGIHSYNPSNYQWVFINSDKTFNSAFKLSEEQYNSLLETGDVM